MRRPEPRLHVREQLTDHPESPDCSSGLTAAASLQHGSGSETAVMDADGHLGAAGKHVDRRIDRPPVRALLLDA
jgi:hypothetical protein